MRSDIFLNKYISHYENAVTTSPLGAMDFRFYFNSIKNDGVNPSLYRSTIKIEGKNSYASKKFKANNIECVTPSGVFAERNDTGLHGKFTDVVVLDLDDKDNEGIDIDEAIKDSKSIPSTLAYHKSVSGKGYAVYVVVDKWAKNTYKFARDYYSVMLGVTFDRSTSNLSRLRYVSYDPNIWIAEDVEYLAIPNIVKRKKQEYKPINTDRQANSDKMIVDLIDVVISNGDDPTSDYNDWFTLGCAIANGWGESGRDMFHKVSSNFHAYDRGEVDAKYDSVLRMGSWKSGKGSIVYILSKFQ